MPKENVGTVRDDGEFGILAGRRVVAHDIGSLSALGSFRVPGTPARTGKRPHLLPRKDQRSRTVRVFEGHFPGDRRFGGIRRTENEHLRTSIRLVQVFQQANLRFVLDRLVRRTVLAHAEAVVRKDILDRKPLQRGHADDGLHEIAKDKERRANRIETAVQRDSAGDSAHREFRDADLDKGSAKIARLHDARFVQELLRLVAVRKIRRRADDVAVVLAEIGEDRSRTVAGRDAFLLLQVLEVKPDALSRKPLAQRFRLVGIFPVPGGLLRFPGAGFPFELFQTPGKGFLHFREDLERIFGIASETADRFFRRSARSGKRLSVRGDLSFERFARCADSALRHRRVPDDNRRTFLFGERLLERGPEFRDAFSIGFENVPAPGFILLPEILVHDVFRLAGKLHAVRIVEEHEIRKLEMPGDAPDPVGDFFLDAAVRDQKNGLVRENVPELGDLVAFRDGDANGHSLS